ncbi:MAG: hypothetical protein IJ419_02680 [Agathobacter sp.]|nr:hypothetical protein [Agathobacter sp.]
MRNKIYIIWLCLLFVAVLVFCIYPRQALKEQHDPNSYAGLSIDVKYQLACGVCIEYMSKNGYGHAESVSVEEVSYGSVKDEIELMKGSYEDDDVLWQLTFVLEGAEQKEVVMFCDPDYHGLRAVLEN